MHSWLNFNGNFIREGQPVITANSRALRYGDGIFETMRYENGEIQLARFHFERLMHGITSLKLPLPANVNVASLVQEVSRTVDRNRITPSARIRLMFFRGDGGLFELDGGGGGYIIQVWPLDEAKKEFNSNGLVLGLYEGAFKSCDGLSNIKSNNYLVYAMAALHAKENRCNDSVVLNTQGRICDASIANIFWIKNGSVFTPPLTEGCIAGVMRRYILEKTQNVVEKACDVETLREADEVFLTNAVAGIRWVQSFEGSNYNFAETRRLFTQLFMD